MIVTIKLMRIVLQLKEKLGAAVQDSPYRHKVSFKKIFSLV